MNLVATISAAAPAADHIDVTVDVRLQADLPTAPPRRSFVLAVPLDVSDARLRDIIGERVSLAVRAWQEQQARDAQAAAVVASVATVGRTFTFTF